MQTREGNNRRAFTLIELLVVIGILIVLASLTLAVFNVGRSSDKMRSAARIAQSAFLGAKDRALHAKDLRGVRLTRDLTNPNLVNGFVYLQPLPLQTTGNISQPYPNNVSVLRPNLASGNTDATNVEVLAGPGSQGLTWFHQDQAGVWPAGSIQVRIPAQTGAWYQLARQNSSPPYWGFIDANNRLNLFLQTGVQSYDTSAPAPVAIDFNSTKASIDIQLGNDALPFHQPITLSSSCVIDLAYSSANVQAIAASNANVDVMFSPRGAVSGYQGGLGPMHFLMRGLKDATAGLNPWIVGGPAVANQDKSTEDRMILTVFPQTGLVQIFEIDPTDTYQNPTPTTPVTSTAGGPSPDGIADNLFNLAQKGKAAGR